MEKDSVNKNVFLSCLLKDGIENLKRSWCSDVGRKTEEYVISKTFFPANLLAQHWKTKPNATKTSNHP